MPPSKETICNHIKYQREYSKKTKRVYNYREVMFKEEGYNIWAETIISVNIYTGNVFANGAIRIGSTTIYRTTVGKQNCNDPNFQRRYSQYVDTGVKNYINKRTSNPIEKEKYLGERRAWRDKNRDKINAQERKRHNENKEIQNKYKRDWRSKQKAEGNTKEANYWKEYYENNKDKINKKLREDRQKDPEKYRDKDRKSYQKRIQEHPEREKDRARKRYLRSKEKEMFKKLDERIFMDPEGVTMSIVTINETGCTYLELGLSEKGRLYRQFAFFRLTA